MTDLCPKIFREQLSRMGERRPYEFPAATVPAHFRSAAILIPFWPVDDDVRVALIRRSTSMRTQPGEVAFAGGIIDPGESVTDAALREAHEEIGLDPSRVELIGRLDDAWSGYGHHIAPVVAWLPEVPSFRPNPAEVDDVIVAPVSEILRPESRSDEELSVAGLSYTNVTLRWEGGQVDRLSAQLLLEALEWASGGRPTPGRARLQSMLESHEILSDAQRSE